MKKIGMIVAVEIDAVLKKYGSKLTKENIYGFDIMKCTTDNYNLVVISSGEGEIAASAATELLISKYNVDFIVNFGLCGGLTEKIEKSKICIVDKIVHYDYDTSTIDPVKPAQYPGYDDIYINLDKDLIEKVLELYPTINKVICASGDKFINTRKNKEDLNKKYNADICEMESAAIALTCNRANIPCVMIKIISDDLFADEKEYYKVKKEASEMCFDIVDRLINEI